MDNPSNTDAGFEVFDDLFDLDVRVEMTGRSGRCSNMTDDTCSQSCPSVGCTATCNCR